MTKRSPYLFAIAGAVAWSALVSGALSWAAGTGKIGFVDVEQVSKKAKFVRNMLQGLESNLGQRQKALDAKREEYDRLKDEIDRKAPVVAEADLDAMRRRSKELYNQVDEETYQINKMLDRAQKEQMEPALDRILEAVKAVGREEGFDLILRGETVLYASPAIDITEKVIERLDSAKAETGKAAVGKTEASKTPALAPGAPAPSPTPTARPKTNSSSRKSTGKSLLRRHRKPKSPQP
jgi:outer membrane protein